MGHCSESAAGSVEVVVLEEAVGLVDGCGRLGWASRDMVVRWKVEGCDVGTSRG